MPHHDRQSACVDRNLVDGIEVVAMVSLACGFEGLARMKTPRSGATFPPAAKPPWSLLTDGALFADCYAVESCAVNRSTAATTAMAKYLERAKIPAPQLDNTDLNATFRVPT